ncbi:nicotinate-nucleotide adenylyltransferase [Candidatus Collierbacteria bacterium CG09_land_8_20_14_0_10_46_12]|uniref:Nicotinamide-nucleotide adenylyltransferase n=1 Tax=Candidatus Collierbacteria bacterium CG09_land_8_20_14_0_10_46_12 TaxID=1974533 RepID=A0A2H0WYT5_9BACT|nr:MAG: nicotinate-nucleotide adenylyltransferase [Candidatus Collierbacteria bacterium CG09_land_8_20_14_0_10_46_12]
MIIYSGMKQYKVALFIGRFQPFHKGHLYSLKKCFELADQVIVGIGSSQESGTENNPWDFETRKAMIESLDLQGDSLKVVALPDYPDDEVWLKEVKERVGNFNVVVSNNEWVLSIMQKAGYKTVETGLFNREELEGVKIRVLMRAGDMNWKLRVPKEVAELIMPEE